MPISVIKVILVNYSFFESMIPRAAGSPNVKIAVVGSGTATIFNEDTSSTNQLIDVAFVPSKGICSQYFFI